MQKYSVTRRGYDDMINELSDLKKVQRPQVILAIATAREHGDLSENAEYSAAREKQSFIEGRIAELEDRIARSEVIDPKKLKSDMVQFGATVTLLDPDGKERVYQLVSEGEANTEKGLLNIASPLGRALIGKKVGSDFAINTPSGAKEYEIINVDYV